MPEDEDNGCNQLGRNGESITWGFRKVVFKCRYTKDDKVF